MFLEYTLQIWAVPFFHRSLQRIGTNSRPEEFINFFDEDHHFSLISRKRSDRLVKISFPFGLHRLNREAEVDY